MTARARSGHAPRPGSPLTTAIPSANASTSSSATTIMRMFVWKPFHTSGNTCRNACGLKNASRKRCMAGRRRLPLLQYRHLREVQVEPLLLPLCDRAVRRQRLDRGVDGGLELAPLRHDGSVLLVRDDLAGDGPVGARLGLLLGRDDRDVEHERVAPVHLHGGEGGRGG